MALLFAGLLLLFIVTGFVFTLYADKRLHKAYPPSGRFTEVTGGVIHWTVSRPNTPTSHPPLVLIHGLAGNMHNFSALETRLSRSYTVYVLDRPGSGHASRLTRTDASFEAQSRMLTEWMQKEQIPPAVIVGHSMGGGIGLNLALCAPDRVRGLVLISPLAAPLEIKASAPVKWALKRPWFRLFAAKVFVVALRRRFSQQQVRAIFYPEAALPSFASEYGGDLSTHSAAFFAASADLASAQRSLHKQSKHYQEIHCPVGVIYGDGDRILSPHQHMGLLKKALPDGTFVMLRDKGHMIPITAVDECASLISQICQTADNTDSA